MIGLNYYALSMSVEQLTGSMNFYVSFCIMALIEVPFVFGLLIAMKYFGRKPLLITSLFAGGAACLISLLIPAKYPTASLWLGVIAKGFSSAASSLKWIYTAELYPTSTRYVYACWAQMQTIKTKTQERRRWCHDNRWNLWMPCCPFRCLCCELTN